MRALWFAVLLLVSIAPARADALDEGWRACQAQREYHTVQVGRIALGAYKTAVRDDCNKIAAQIHARPQPKPPTEQDLDAAAKAAIKAAKP